MKNQKSPGFHIQTKIGHLAPAAGPDQLHPLAMSRAFAPPRKIPIFYHFALAESVIVKNAAPAFIAQSGN